MRTLTSGQAAQKTATGHSAFRIVAIEWADATRYYCDRDPAKDFNPDASKTFSKTLLSFSDAPKRLDLSLAETIPSQTAQFSLLIDANEIPNIKSRVESITPVGLTVTFYKVFQPASGSLTSADWLTLGRYRISRFVVGRQSVTFEAVDMLAAITDKIIGRAVEKTILPNAPSESCGKTIPLVIGAVDALQAIKISSAPQTTLDESITDTETEIEVADGSQLSASGVAWIDSEKVSFTRSVDTLTVTRGEAGTAATSHPWGTVVEEIADVVFVAADCPIDTVTNVRTAEGALYDYVAAWKTEPTLNGTVATYITVPSGSMPGKLSATATAKTIDLKDAETPMEFRRNRWNTVADAENAVDTDIASRDATFALIRDDSTPITESYDDDEPAGAAGDPTVQGALDPQKITAVTSAAPIYITTAAPHGLTTGDEVLVSGVLGTTAANGEWTVTVDTVKRVSLDGSDGLGAAYTSGGRMVPIDLEAKNIETVTNQTPILVTASDNHGLADGDSVRIAGVGGCTNANGTHVITKVDNKRFTLDGTTGNGAYTGGGTYVGIYVTTTGPKRVLAVRTNTSMVGRTGTIKKCLAYLKYAALLPANKVWPVGTFRPFWSVVPGNNSACLIPIATATNANPIVVTTTAAHYLETGDFCEITGVTGNDAANSQWQITKIDATSFSLDGGIGTGAGTGGRVVRVFSEYITEPTDITGDSKLYPEGGNPATDDSRELFEDADAAQTVDNTYDLAYVSGEGSTQYTIRSGGVDHTTIVQSWPNCYLVSEGGAFPFGADGNSIIGSDGASDGEVIGGVVRSITLALRLNMAVADVSVPDGNTTIQFEFGGTGEYYSHGIAIAYDFGNGITGRTDFTRKEHPSVEFFGSISKRFTRTLSASEILAARFYVETYAVAQTDGSLDMGTLMEQINSALVFVTRLKLHIIGGSVALPGATTALDGEIKTLSSRAVQKMDISDIARRHGWNLFSTGNAALNVGVIFPKKEQNLELNIYDIGFEVEEVSTDITPMRDKDATLLLDCVGLGGQGVTSDTTIATLLTDSTRFGDLTTDDYDTTSLTSAVNEAETDAGEAWVFSRILYQPITLGALLAEAVTDAGIRWTIDSGKIKFFAGLSSDAADVQRALTYADRIADDIPAEEATDFGLIANEIDLYYDINSDNTNKKVSLYETFSQEQPWGVRRAEYFAKWLSSATLAATLAERLGNVFAWPIALTSYVVSAGRGLELECGVDSVSITDPLCGMNGTVGRVMGLEYDETGARLALQVGIASGRARNWQKITSVEAASGGVSGKIVYFNDGTYVEYVRGSTDALNFWIGGTLCMSIKMTSYWSGGSIASAATLCLRGQVEERNLPRPTRMTDSGYDSPLPLLVEYDEIGGGIWFGATNDFPPYGAGTYIAAKLKPNGSLECYGGVSESSDFPTASGQGGDPIGLVGNDLMFSADGGDRYLMKLEGGAIDWQSHGKLYVGRIWETSL